MDLPRNLFPRKDAKHARQMPSSPRRTLAARSASTKAIDDALGSGWYAEHGNKADRAAFVLCRLRRARGGQWEARSGRRRRPRGAR